jgi:hypothetical protein
MFVRQTAAAIVAVILFRSKGVFPSNPEAWASTFSSVEKEGKSVVL